MIFYINILFQCFFSNIEIQKSITFSFQAHFLPEISFLKINTFYNFRWQQLHKSFGCYLKIGFNHLCVDAKKATFCGFFLLQLAVYMNFYIAERRPGRYSHFTLYFNAIIRSPAHRAGCVASRIPPCNAHISVSI